eukprot:CAMPEP_0194268630 /NCGR_PEP_ID=MMETSP0169-20130528/2921_1 /TAXON_ID=218684 /ORGANISM="Corethron pennatum, Strain L29A3" /LENGTH=187 /DNA_ID=CAMNT_0039009927 /DNA_START=46 /DNA_END=609 /DNA_ORIENTATION=-
MTAVSKARSSEGVRKNERSSNPIVFMDVTIGSSPRGRITLELRADVAPITAENFRQLATGEGGPRLYYGSGTCPFHRAIKGFMAQGGDITNGDGTGGSSIYGDKFEDETFALKHSETGTLSMANSGPNTNGSQFFLTTAATPWLDGKHVVFGKVIDGLDVLLSIEQVGSESGDTRVPVMISDSGQLR